MAGVGGWSDTMDANEDIQKICDQVKPKLSGFNFREFNAVKYRNQIVAGTNFLIKVHVGGEDYIHLSLFQELSCDGGKVVLNVVELNKTKDAPLTPCP
ncbi:cystatin-B-like [Cebidichthys violaceus]|uniref:cystatin-B-like n=1 Tax=Cebidichthys violaceus TaxID=271503 RepID=UPI0035CB30D9